ncbi:hypothetical protein AKJ09_00245 [Labilithrix luteola]|uniref:Uncharacterized protein n=1 Tax=Labilithrix luteola TaxID=1391654 RepID=A0A0K1PJJ2_9BACT|nr:hypothetical protein AKJ09_00245 [Labilithrix luteola]
MHARSLVSRVHCLFCFRCFDRRLWLLQRERLGERSEF